MTHNTLVQVTTSDGLFLHGYYAPSDDKKTCVLFIHGFESNFYEDNFIYALAKEFESKGIGFLAGNTRGNGKDTDFDTVGGKYRRIGSRYELLEEAHLDITAWLDHIIDDGTKEIILMGHSLGTMKAVRYLFEGEHRGKINKLILLAPFDKKGLIKSVLKKDIDILLTTAKKMVDAGKGSKLNSRELAGHNISHQTFLSWYKQDDLGRVFEFCTEGYDFPVLKQIQVPSLVVVGSKDEFFYPSAPEHPEIAMDILLKNIPDSKGIIIEGAVHSFRSHEDIMVKEVIDFVS